jgi:site-specific DNA-adenine methylase
MDPDALIYFDAPYLHSERVQKSGYGVYEVDAAFHVESAETLRTLPGMVVVSGKKCDLYTELYEDHGWPRVDIEARSNGGEDKTESLWLSPKTHRALHKDFTDLPLFAVQNGGDDL